MAPWTTGHKILNLPCLSGYSLDSAGATWEPSSEGFFVELNTILLSLFLARVSDSSFPRATLVRTEVLLGL